MPNIPIKSTSNGLKNKFFLLTGVHNKKSIAYAVAKILTASGARLCFTVQHLEQKTFVAQQFPESSVMLCDVTQSKDIAALENWEALQEQKLDGFLHSIAFARLNPEWSFEQTPWDAFSEAIRISCYSLMELSAHLKNKLHKNASVVTLSISTTRATSYGYMGPIKAMLNSAIDYLAKSFSRDSEIRFNAIGSGPLKTSASAGIPGYIDHYLYAEQLTLRHRALTTDEVAQSVCFLLSPLSSGINATTLTIDAGMSVNYFDEQVVQSFVSAKDL